MAKVGTRKRAVPYTSDTLATSRKMVADGALHEARAVIYDLMWRARSREQMLPYYDRKTGKPFAEEARRFRDEAQRRIDELPVASEALKRNLTRQNWER